RHHDIIWKRWCVVRGARPARRSLGGSGESIKGVVAVGVSQSQSLPNAIIATTPLANRARAPLVSASTKLRAFEGFCRAIGALQSTFAQVAVDGPWPRELLELNVSLRRKADLGTKAACQSSTAPSHPRVAQGSPTHTAAFVCRVGR